MKNSIRKTLNLIAAVFLLAEGAWAQQTPSAPSHAAPTAKSQTGAKPTTQPAPAAGSPGASALKTQKDKVSYAIGLNFGRGLHRDTWKLTPTFSCAA